MIEELSPESAAEVVKKALLDFDLDLIAFNIVDREDEIQLVLMVYDSVMPNQTFFDFASRPDLFIAMNGLSSRERLRILKTDYYVKTFMKDVNNQPFIDAIVGQVESMQFNTHMCKL